MSGRAYKSRRDAEMNCSQFQEVLPHIIESGGNVEEEAHLKSCQGCSELVRDLKYIAEQARLLLPMRDPNPRVWSNIQQSLEREGLLQEGRMSRLGHITTAPPKKKLDAAGHSARRSRNSSSGHTSGKLPAQRSRKSGSKRTQHRASK